MRTFFIVLLVLSFSAIGDVQINQQAKKYHSPWGADVNNDEFKVTFSGPTGCVGGNCTSVRAIEHEVTYLCWDLPAEISALAIGETLTVTSSEVNETCAVTDPDGNETTKTHWQARHVMQTDLTLQEGEPGYHWNVCEIRHKLWCSDTLP